MKRQTLWAAALAVLSVSFAVAPSFAQQAPGGQGRRGGGRTRGGALGLLRMPEVQKELSLQPAQVDLLQAIQPTRGQGGGQDFRSLSPEERTKQFAEMRKDTERKVAEVLDAKQMARLKQLELQQEGTRAIVRTDVADTLKLTPDQRTKAQTAIQSERDAAAKLFPRGGRGGAGAAPGGADAPRTRPTPEQIQANLQKMQDLRKSRDAQLEAILTPAQKKQFATLQGAPFKFPERQFGGGRPGGQRRPAAPAAPAKA